MTRTGADERLPTPGMKTEWAADACICGCPRSAHQLGKRLPWPCTGRGIRGRCATCPCTAFKIDAEALAAREAAIAAERIADLHAMLADPHYGKRRPSATAGLEATTSATAGK